MYTEADVERIRELTRLRDLLGLSLDELRSMIVAEDVRAEIRRRFQETDSREEQLALLDEALPHIETQLDTRPSPACPRCRSSRPSWPSGASASCAAAATSPTFGSSSTDQRSLVAAQFTTAPYCRSVSSFS